MPTLDIPIKLLDPDGGWVNAPVHVSELDELPVLLHFFSTKEVHGAADFDELKRFISEYASRGLRVISVDVTRSEKELRDTNAVEALARKYDLRHPIAVDDGSMAKAYGVTQTPAWLVFDAETGLLRHHFTGRNGAHHVRQVIDRFTRYDTSAAAPAP
ncbi:TlpA family protein disulfide reductase [Pyxidicoccus parkwayensis]|uniref:TlpA family protein disulfide reductase n=1 Tax=Pyxidicoccus parkwayensis TaxID=2813578 RepID=A0ABX7NQE3_9BACT|nr:TlpA disulfide reductase family protein [Pyxidicoccus parkwaysis]QSQ19795.1 TlpA family protein disulfide reductase [Pyxidicoccus parkwaysis]